VIYFKPLADSNINVELCGWFQCSAENNVIAHSSDGTLFKSHTDTAEVTAGIFIPKNLDKADSTICDRGSDSMNAIKCTYSDARRYVQLVAEMVNDDQ